MPDSPEPLPTPPQKRDLFLTYLRLVGPLGNTPEEAQRVVGKLEAAPPRPLAEPHAPPRPGIYALYLAGHARPVYVGKAGGRRGLQGRLADHLDTLGRHDNVDPANVRCRFVIYSRRTPLAYLEGALIRHFRPEWNRLVGFGSGRSRGGLPPVGRWEQRYPRKAQRAAEVRVPYSTTGDSGDEGAVGP